MDGPTVTNSSVVWQLKDGSWALAKVPLGWSYAKGDRYPATFDIFDSKDKALDEQKRRYGPKDSK